METITRTIKKTVYNCTVYNRTKKMLEEQKFTLDKELDEESAMKFLGKRYNGATMTIADIASKESIEQLYGMPVETFLLFARPLVKPDPSLITRTIKNTVYHCIVYYRDTKKMEEVTFTLNKLFDNDTALKILSKKYNNSSLTIADIASTESIEQLYGITVEKFIENASPINKDSKEG